MSNPFERKAIPPSAERVFKGILFDVYQWEQELFDGSTATFEKLKRQDSATIIPVLANGNLLITEDEQPNRDLKITFPGGQLEEDESPELGARRELLEETGYAPDELILWKVVEPSSKMDWVISVFIARGCKKVADPTLDAGERIKVREIHFDEALLLPDDSRFQNTDLALDLMRARYDTDAHAKLKKLLFG